MSDVPEKESAPAVAGVADTRFTPLAALAGEGSREAADALRNVLPKQIENLPVCAFGSSI